MAARIRLRGLGQYAGFVRVRYNAAMPPTSKLRHLFHALSVLSAVACVLLIVLWVRSYTVADRLHGRFWGQQSFVLGSNEGRLAAVAYPSSDELSFPVGWARAYESTLGFGWFENPETTLSQTWDLGIGSDMVVHIGSGPIVPYWFHVTVRHDGSDPVA